jgi:hypothetical protein
MLVPLVKPSQQKTPNAYIKELKKELTRFFAEIAFEKPEATGSNLLESYLQSLLDFLLSLSNQTSGTGNEQCRPHFNALIQCITQGCTETITETIYITRSAPVYKQIPIYKEIEEIDYTRPIEKEEVEYVQQSYWSDTNDPIEFLDSIFDGNTGRVQRWRTIEKKRRVIIGYETRMRRVLDGYEKISTGSILTSEPAGTRIVETQYHPFGLHGIALLATCCNVIVAQNADTQTFEAIEQLYAQMVDKLREPLANCHLLSATSVVQVLKKFADVLFTPLFQENIKRFSHM